MNERMRESQKTREKEKETENQDEKHNDREGEKSEINQNHDQEKSQEYNNEERKKNDMKTAIEHCDEFFNIKQMDIIKNDNETKIHIEEITKEAKTDHLNDEINIENRISETDRIREQKMLDMLTEKLKILEENNEKQKKIKVKDKPKEKDKPDNHKDISFPHLSKDTEGFRKAKTSEKNNDPPDLLKTGGSGIGDFPSLKVGHDHIRIEKEKENSESKNKEFQNNNNKTQETIYPESLKTDIDKFLWKKLREAILNYENSKD
jgi:hypothetical protein